MRRQRLSTLRRGPVRFQVLGEEANNLRRRAHAVGSFLPAVTLIGEEGVIHRHAARFHGTHDLLGLDHRHVGVVRTITHEQGRGDATQLVDGRQRFNMAACVAGSPYSVVEIAATPGFPS